MIDVTPFQAEIKAIELRFLGEVSALLKRLSTLSKQEQLILLREIDFLTRLNTHGLDGVLGKMSKSMTLEINKLRKFYIAKGLDITANFTPLSALIQADMQQFLGQYQYYASGIKQNLIQGVVAHTPRDVLVKQLQIMSVGTLSSRNANFIMEETFMRFDHAVTAQIFEDKEDSALFIYIGVRDNKNRDSCAALLDQGNEIGWTIDEINAGEAHPEIDFVSRGGFNCRHTWVTADKQPESFYERKKD